VKKKRLVIVAALAIGAALPAVPALALFGPLPVTDVLAEPVWLKQLVQAVYEGESLHAILTTELQNVVPTEARWALNTGNPVAMAPLLTTAVDEYNAYSAQVETNTGAPPPPNEALGVAQAGMVQLPQDEDDLTNAQTASDACEGDLCAQQSGHRFQQLQTTNGYEQKQFDYAKYIQEQKGQMAAAAWMTQ
jgi:hypothetical protein